MANGEYVTWNYMHEHEQKADEGFQRLTTLEVEMKQAKEILEENRTDIKSLQKTVWSASAVATAIVVILELVLKSHG